MLKVLPCAIQVLYLLIWMFNLSLKEGSVVLSNCTPYDIVYAIKTPSYDPNVKYNKGWINLKAGTKKNLKFSFRGLNEVWVSAYSVDEELVRYVYDIPENEAATIYYDSGVEVEYLDVPEEKHFDNSISQMGPFPPLGNEIGFMKINLIPSEDIFHYKASYTFIDADLPFIGYSNNKIDDALKRSKILHKSFETQIAFDKKYEDLNNDFPYDIGASLGDNGFDIPGVIVDDIFREENIYGDELPLRIDDEIVTINSQLIFGYSDFFANLEDHARDINHGVKSPIELEVIREGRFQKINTVFFFNEAYYGLNEKERQHAMGYGLADGITAGFGNEVVPRAERVAKEIYNFFVGEKDKYRIEPLNEDIFTYTQNHARLKQFYGKEFSYSSVGGSLISPGVLLHRTLAKNLVKKGLSRGLSSTLSIGTIELSEGAVWLYNSRSPLKSDVEITQDLIDGTIENAKFLGAFLAIGKLYRSKKQ